MDQKTKDIFSGFDYSYNSNEVMNEVMKHILFTQSSLMALRDLIIDSAAVTQQKDVEVIYKEYDEDFERYFQELLTEWTGRYGQIRNPKSDGKI